MNCASAQNMMSGYLDERLNTGAAAEMNTHLQGCAHCAGEALTSLRLRQTLREVVREESASPKLKREIAAGLRPRARFGWMPALALATAAVLVLAVSLGARRPSVAPMQELVDLHVTTLASNTPMDVLSSDKHTVKPWFAGKIPFTFNLPEEQGHSFRLLGGKVAYLQQTAGAHLLYQIRLHRVSVYVFPENATALPDRDASVNTFNAESWKQNGLRYVALSDVARTDLEELCAAMKAAQ